MRALSWLTVVRKSVGGVERSGEILGKVIATGQASGNPPKLVPGWLA